MSAAEAIRVPRTRWSRAKTEMPTVCGSALEAVSFIHGLHAKHIRARPEGRGKRRHQSLLASARLLASPESCHPQVRAAAGAGSTSEWSFRMWGPGSSFQDFSVESPQEPRGVERGDGPEEGGVSPGLGGLPQAVACAVSSPRLGTWSGSKSCLFPSSGKF